MLFRRPQKSLENRIMRNAVYELKMHKRLVISQIYYTVKVFIKVPPLIIAVVVSCTPSGKWYVGDWEYDGPELGWTPSSFSITEDNRFIQQEGWNEPLDTPKDNIYYLQNSDGVYVLTPTLNKSFKFQSDWPYNNSQVYILSSIIDDLNKDTEVKKEEVDGKYIFTSKVNYPNNSKLIKQKVTVTKDLFIEKIEILNEQEEIEMSFTINNTDYNPTFDESFFEVNSIINSNANTNEEENKKEIKDKNTEETKEEIKCDPTKDSNCKVENNTNNASPQNNNKNIIIATKITSNMNGQESENNNKKTTPTASLEDVIYPLYLPTGTVLKEQEKVNKTDGERIILTFAGDKEFTLVEETAVKEKEFTVIPTFGEPGFVNDTIGAITDNSLNWISNGIEYYMVSDVMNVVELLDIANSINVKAVASLK